MGLGIWAGLKAAFTVPGIAKGVLEKGGDMLDDAFFTKQERADADLKKIDYWLVLQKVTESAQKAITRRILAVMAYGVFFLQILLMIFVVTVLQNKEMFDRLLEILKLYLYIIGAITFFYFGTWGVGTYMKRKEKK